MSALLDRITLIYNFPHSSNVRGRMSSCMLGEEGSLPVGTIRIMSISSFFWKEFMLHCWKVTSNRFSANRTLMQCVHKFFLLSEVFATTWSNTTVLLRATIQYFSLLQKSYFRPPFTTLATSCAEYCCFVAVCQKCIIWRLSACVEFGNLSA